jgi:hypothetical protein
MEESIDTNGELTFDKIAEIALPKDAFVQERFNNSEMPTNITEFMPLRDFFGIQDMDRKTQEQLQNVWEFFSKDAKNPGTVLKRIKMQQINLAAPNVGDTRLNQLNNYIRVLQQLSDAKDMKEAYEQ